ncbi:thiamine pyrophosphokinase-related protein [Aspergillus cavernicola]|uniref:Thiamine pyrophosphokinase-related protein n=1 Tax=Aspergillus cavernicola TaxID=176166 RepID=A0ABR4I3F5_9EURO
MTKTILDVVKECDNFDPNSQPKGPGAKCYTFHVNGYNTTTLGYLLPSIVQKIHWSSNSSWSINHSQKTVTLATPPTATSAMRSSVLEDTLQATKRQATISILESWRDESFPVYGPRGEIVLEIERCASALFGIVTYGVQLVCFVKNNQEDQDSTLLLWIGKRSTQKQTYPGLLDTTAAGGLSAHKRPLEALITEAREEAALPEKLVRENVKPTGYLSYYHVRGPKAGGGGGGGGDSESGLFQPEIEYTYELELDASVVLEPGDSEVESFRLYPVAEVLDALREGLFKPNSGIVVVDFLIRHGVLKREEEILGHLHRELELPVLIQASD